MIGHLNEVSQKANLRERIIVKSTQAFTTHGIKSITMDDIASSLGISKRTLYEVFADKESLLKECLLKVQEERDQYLKEVLDKSDNVLEVILSLFKRNIEALHHTNKRFFVDVKKYPKVYEIMKNKQEADSKNAMSFFKLGIDQGIFRSDINFPIVNMLVREQFNVLLNTEICDEYSFVDVYESIMFTYIRGISTEKGAKVLDDFILEYRRNQLK